MTCKVQGVATTKEKGSDIRPILAVGLIMADWSLFGASAQIGIRGRKDFRFPA